MTTLGTGTLGDGTLGDPTASPMVALPTSLSVAMSTPDTPSLARPALSTFTDDYATLDATKWQIVNAAAFSSRARLNVSNPSSVAYAFIISQATYDFTDSYLLAKVVPNLNAGAGYTTRMRVQVDQVSNYYLDIVVITDQYTGQSINWVANTAGTVTSGTSAAYNATNHLWWRIRHQSSNNTVYFSVSPDAVTWTDLGSYSVAAWSTTTLTSAMAYCELTTSVSADPAQVAYFDNLNMPYQGTSTPDSINDAVTVTAPDLGFFPDGSLATPDSTADAVTIDAPTAAFDAPTAPDDGPAVTVTIDAPTAALDMASTPDSINDPVTTAAPDAAFDATTTPDSITAPVTVDPPAAAVDMPVTPDGTGDPVTTDPVDITGDSTAFPDSATAPLAIDAPTAVMDMAATPDSTTDPVTTDPPATSQQAITDATPDPVNDPVTVDPPTAALDLAANPDDGPAPTVVVDPPTVTADVSATPDGATDAVTVDAPTVDYVPPPNSTDYGTNNYGEGTYGGGAGTVTPTAITIAVSVGDSDLTVTGPGTTPTDPEPADTNTLYGAGIYGEGIYHGTLDPEVQPLFKPVAATGVRTPLHVLGVGPWSPAITWRGAANYGITTAKRPARPTVALPATTSKSFTLRLNEASEARIDLALTRTAAIVVEEMNTDLWWQRRDPYTGVVDTIGRFNAANVDIASADTGITLSCQFQDYRALLADRRVLIYKDPVHSESMWNTGTLITDILRFAVPTNMGLNLTAISAATPADLGVTTTPFELPPGTTIAELFDNLRGIASNAWEWHVEQPTINDAPTLTFTAGTRGADRGVHLADLGIGPTPIAGFRMQAASDRYANSMYFSGSVGGVIVDIPAQIAQYGQRDATDNDSSIGGDPAALKRAADNKLAELADRRPTFAITLTPGFWRGRTHIDVGDTVRVTYKLGRELITGSNRVTELTADIDATGAETVSLTLGVPPVSTDPRSKRSALSRLVRKLKNYERKGPA